MSSCLQPNDCVNVMAHCTSAREEVMEFIIFSIMYDNH